MKPQSLILTAASLGLTLGSAHAVTALVDFSGGTTTGTAVTNTNALSSGTLSIAAGAGVDLTGTASADLAITASGSQGIHVNGGGANLDAASVTSNAAISSVFSSYQHAYTSTWGAINGGAGNTYSLDITGLKAGTQYTVSILSGRGGGIGLPTGMSSTWTLDAGSATVDTGASQFDFWDDSASSSSVIQETGTGPYTMSYQLAFDDAGMTTWVFDFVNPINAMVITTVVPEPSSTALLGLGGLALILRRRK